MVVNIQNHYTDFNEWKTVKPSQSNTRWKAYPIKRNNKKRMFDEDDNMVVSINGNIFLYPPKAGVVIFNQNFTKVLLVSNNYDTENGKLGFPKGHIEGKESYEDCAKREVYEETGLNIDIPQNSKFLTVNNSKYYVFVLDREDYNDFMPIDKREIKYCSFINIDDFDNLDINKETRVLLNKKKNLAKKYAIPISF